MSQNNLLQGYNWDSQYEDAQFSRPLQDEVISVYEVYVKEEETLGSDGRSDGSVVSGSTTSISGESSNTNEHQLIQDDCMDLDAEIDSEIINVDGTVTKLLGKDSLKYKMVEQSANSVDDAGIVVHPNNQTVSEQNGNSSSTGPHLIDKDDPRSRLHFVKYLKRDGKTLKIWECGICTKEFRHQYTLMRHLPTHTDERNFKCDACGKAFRQLSTLSQHKAIHSDARPYICEFCKKTFNRVSTLISHRKTHSEHKPHKCHVCGKGFHQKGNLRNHVFTHTNERPYKCELCGKGFNQMSNLVCHKIKAHAHTEKGQYSCGLCGKEFPRRFALRSHEEYKHGIKYRNPGGISREQKLRDGSKNSTSTSTCTSSTASNTPSISSNPPTVISNGATIIHGGNSGNGPNVMRNKNVRVVELPNGERHEGLVEIGESEMEYTTDSIVVERIDTKALENAIVQGQTPFALLKPVKGIPVLVKVSPAGPHKHLLTPANADDVRMIGKMTLSPNIMADPEGLKALQVKVPVVAMITQHIDDNGKQCFTVEAPGPDQDLESLVDSHFPFQDTESSLRLHSASSASVYERRGSVEFDEDTTAGTTTIESNYQSDDCSELLELAAQGGIQFVRATEDGRYEVMSNSEARELMAQNSHDVTILDGEDADALNIVDSRVTETTSCIQEDLMIDDPDSQIMVLDSLGSAQKSIGLEGIEILEDKDIRILDPKNLDDRMIDGMTFLSQMKMDDLIIVPGKSTSNGVIDDVAGCTISIGSPGGPVARELSGILGQRNEITHVNNNCNGQQTINVNCLIGKSQAQQQTIINETMNYLRNCPTRGLTGDFVNEGGDEATIGHENSRHQHYGGKLRFNDFVDETIETEDTLNTLSKHAGHTNNCSRISDYYRVNETRNYWDNQRNIPSFGEVKILGSKVNNEDLMENSTMQLQDIRILGSYEQYLNSTTFGQQQQQQQFGKNHYVDEALPVGRKEIKILGKKLECGFFENSEDGKLVKIEDDKDKRMRMVLPRDSSRSPTPNSPEFTSEDHSKGDMNFLLQTCSPDYLKFDKSQRDNGSPEHTEYERNETRSVRQDFERLAEFD